jgi:hypothetical protein
MCRAGYPASAEVRSGQTRQLEHTGISLYIRAVRSAMAIRIEKLTGSRHSG